MVTKASVPVLIVGAGVAGLASAALLAQHGVESLLVEKRREVFIYPKARNLTFRTLEILRALGLADQVHAVADGVSNMMVKPALNSSSEATAMDIEGIFSSFVGLSPEPAAQYCPQSRLEPILLDQTRRTGGGVRYGTGLLSFTEDPDGVTAVLQSDTGTETVRADYLIAADGVRSPVRTALGIATSGYGALPIFVVFIYFRAPWQSFIPGLGDGDAVQVRNSEVDGVFVAVDAERGMFITTYLPERGESADQFTPDHCRAVLTAAIGESIDIEIIEVAPWQPYELVADQFRHGRTFLVGDAAHTMPPFKAGGANTAIQSAHNLAWKLAAVHHGTAGPGLLATYHDERYPIGRFAAHQSLVGPPLAFLQLDRSAPALLDGEEAPLFTMILGYQYHSAAVVSDVPSVETVSFVEELRGQPGTRMPHIWQQRGEGRVSTLDLIGAGFTLFTAGDVAAWTAAASAVAATFGVGLGVQPLDEDGVAQTDLGSGGALLVRPDDFVGWRTDDLPEDPETALRQVFSSILDR
ncbi:NAD(P)-binding protein [Mycobacterium sp. CBMA247]|nr:MULTISPECIES: FAD-dependent monooxygenase [unclassified Mycolicibacterium]MUL83769.1 NAD(P)-binding protein [Mycolicibacterium sp. CBMA 329]MUL90760.1 NAD(P)-binding protein [Mycolicibacterium sp. CBMA 331]MUM00728.1 NAD(P)-binding protein [Mycolicibacterium sp. CBMA 334]MUM27509.1 NAD(P)-binding protein [Mycolicibacterium sp. CBMA 295]MUM41704.1 NAD(P)-binding protein [Mycolicibacterium sp. CBMA 247]